MTTHDTDPQASAPVFGSSGAGADTTEPGAPPGDSDGASSKALALALLENVGTAVLPTEGVAQTNGHTAAAFAATHQPPKAREIDREREPGVVLNTTQPLPIALPLTPPPAPAIATQPLPADTVPMAARQETTVPGRRPAKSGAPIPIVIIALLLGGLTVWWVIHVWTSATAHRDAVEEPVSTVAPKVEPVPVPIRSAPTNIAMPQPSPTPSVVSAPTTVTTRAGTSTTSTSRAASPALPSTSVVPSSPASAAPTQAAPRSTAAAPVAPPPPSASRTDLAPIQ